MVLVSCAGRIVYNGVPDELPGVRRVLEMAGYWFDELQVGQVIRHTLRRTISETDNVLFCSVTNTPASTNLIGFEAAVPDYPRAAVGHCLTLALMIGIAMNDTTLGTGVTDLGLDEVRYLRPVLHGDTIQVETEVVELMDSPSRPDQGIVTYCHRAFNQREELVASCLRSGLQRRRPQI